MVVKTFGNAGEGCMQLMKGHLPFDCDMQPLTTILLALPGSLSVLQLPVKWNPQPVDVSPI